MNVIWRYHWAAGACMYNLCVIVAVSWVVVIIVSGVVTIVSVVLVLIVV
jgi:hypothetical protein